MKRLQKLLSMVLACAMILGSLAGNMVVLAAGVSTEDYMAVGDTTWKTATTHGFIDEIKADDFKDLKVAVSSVVYSGYSDSANNVPNVNASNYQNIILNVYNESIDLKNFNASDSTIGYAINDRWVAGKPTDAAIASLFNRGGVLKITDRMADNNRGPAVGTRVYDGDAGWKQDVIPGIVVVFERIEPRPSAPRVTVNYGVYATGKDGVNDITGGWTLLDATSRSSSVSTSFLAGLSIRTSETDTTTGETWYKFPTATSYVVVKPLSSDGKVIRTSYFVRTAATITTDSDGKHTNTPASRSARVNVTSLQAAPKLRPDYRREIIRARVGMVLNFDGTEAPVITAATAAYAIDKVLGDSIVSVTVYQPVNSDRPNRPRTARQQIDLAARAKLAATPVTTTKGVLRLDKTYEVLNNNRWGGMPRVTTVRTGATFGIRLRSTARVEVNNAGTPDVKTVAKSGTAAASATGTLTYSWGDLPDQDPNAKKTTRGFFNVSISTATP